MSMNDLQIATSVNTDYQSVLNMIPTPGEDGELMTLAHLIDIGFQTATPTLGNVDITTVSGTMALYDTTNMARHIGEQVALYWGGVTATSGSPEATSIISVSNNSEIVIDPIEAKLIGAVDNIVGPIPYLEFITIINTEVRKIVWVVEELDGPSTVSFSVNVT